MSLSSTIPSFITSFPHYTACILKTHVLLFQVRNNAHTAHLDVSPQHIAYCCFKCPILTLLLYSAIFCYFPFYSVIWSFFVLEKNPPKTPLLCPLLLTTPWQKPLYRMVIPLTSKINPVVSSQLLLLVRFWLLSTVQVQSACAWIMSGAVSADFAAHPYTVLPLFIYFINMKSARHCCPTRCIIMITTFFFFLHLLTTCLMYPLQLSLWPK